MMNTHTVGGFPMAMDAAGIATGQAFLIGELEKRERDLLLPLASVTWPRDIVVDQGGGVVDYTSFQAVDYATSGTNQWGIVTGQTNVIPTISANITKDVFPVFPWMNNIEVPYLDQMRMQTIGRSLDQIFEDGLRLNYDKTLDQNVYLGFTDYNTTGLCNNPNITAANAPLNGGATSRLWINKTPTEILNDFNTALNACWAASEYDLTGIPNHILIPPAKFGYLNTTLISSAGTQSILEYIKKHNVAQSQGRPLEILPCRQTIGIGAGSTDRMVAYVNDKSRVMFDIPVPLRRQQTLPTTQLKYVSTYLSFFGVVKFKYYQCAYYMDGI